MSALENAMKYSIQETIETEYYQPIHIVRLESEGRKPRYTFVRALGSNYATPVVGGGSYAGQSLAAVARYALDHSPGVRAYGHLRDVRRAVKRLIDAD